MDIVSTEDDCLTPDAGDWAEEKGGLLSYYSDLFAASMKNKWKKRVYIDLFAGAGKVRVRESTKILLGSPLLALRVRVPFDRYIFCDHDPARLEALQRRVEREHADADVRFVPGDVNDQVRQILDHMPLHSPGQGVLGFCFADPNRLQDLKFNTLLALSARFMDFLIHVPAMDPQRAWQHYLSPENPTVDEFVGTAQWRDEWQRRQPPPPLDVFVAEIVDRRMKECGFVYGGCTGPAKLCGAYCPDPELGKTKSGRRS
jgi:three-Cys-motif partner protein